MKVNLEIKTESDAFAENAGAEMARILRDAAARIEDWPGANGFVIGLFDAKGNKAGTMVAAEGGAA